MTNQTTDPGLCPVATLADEAAALAKIWRVMRDAIAGRDGDAYTLDDLFRGLGWNAHGAEQMLPNEFTREVLSRLRAIASLAPHRQATSLRGVAFQTLLTSHKAADLLGEPLGGASAEAAMKVAASIDRCVVSILAQLAASGAALPGDLLEFYGMGRGEQPCRIVQLILALPAAA